MRCLRHLERCDNVDFTGHEVKSIDGQAELVADSRSAKDSKPYLGKTSLLDKLIVAKAVFDDTHDMTDVGNSLWYHDWLLWVMFGLAESQGDK